ncbi:MFS transporter, PAT family, beta-lactamase induction signal transducer AmpG [Izhakiella capsodis]|uniref:Anhydromuropeptide permease n=1 Tax=Izhakiella capsodis TaxID=1367852 RepID=A0A1I4YHR1_9GAMM|nr:muropeptide MFS transporter AmpG [Izhakiella capsodis]SFN37119.1 MFS transporter, PAT family, beta-lactamase induction signal transducer AmpG [Izhakiella capsodis]
MTSHYLKIFTQRKSAILLILGFASGLPLALTAGTLQAWMSVENVDTKTIGFFSLVGQAYVLKFLWSPLMDRFTLPFLGRRRGWLLLTQIALIAAIALMGTLQPSRDLTMLAALAVLVAFCSASQDIVFDAWKTDILSAEERGAGAAITVLGYRLAMMVSGGLALWLADKYLGWQATYWLMALAMIPGVIATLLAPEPSQKIEVPQSLHAAVFTPLKEFFSRSNAWMMLSLIIFYKLGDAFATSLSTLFLLKGLGFDPGQVGIVNKTLGLAATIIGALFGGILMQRMTLFRALVLFGILQGISNLGYWLLAVTPPHIWSMAMAVTIENLCGGMGTAAFVALLMALCNKSFSATQFALLSALSAIGRVYVGPAAGWIAAGWGWSTLFAISLIASLPGLLLLIASRQSFSHLRDDMAFTLRHRFETGYRLARYLAMAGAVLLACWLLLITLGALKWFNVITFSEWLFAGGIICLFAGVTAGTLLDLRSQHCRPEI